LAQQEQQKQEHQQQQQQQQYKKVASSNYWRTAQSGITKDTSGAAEERGGSRNGGLLRTCCIIIVVVAVERIRIVSDWCCWYRHIYCSNGHDCCRYRFNRSWYVGPGELLRAPPTRAAQAGTWANGPGHTRAGLTSNSWNILVSTRSPTKQQREQRHQVVWYKHAHQIVRCKNKEQRRKQKQKESISNITSEETLKFGHSSRKSLTHVIIRWRENKKKVCKLSNDRNIHRNSQWKVYLRYLEGKVKKRGYIIQRYWRYIAAGILRITAATTISLQSASRELKRIKKQSACGREDFSFDGSNAGPPATARPQYGLFTSRIHCKSASSSSSLVDERNIEERKATAKKLVICSGKRKRTAAKHIKECRRRRQNIGDISVPDHLFTLMRLDSLVGLTGPSTSKKKRNKKRKEQRTEGKEEEEEEEEEKEKKKKERKKVEKEKEEKEKEEKKKRKEEDKKKEKKKERKKKEEEKKDKKKEQLRSSSLLPSISFVEYVPFVCTACCSYTSSKSFSKSNRDCNIDDGGVFIMRCHVDKAQYRKYELDKEIGTATAFHVSCDFALYEVVRVCMHNCHRDYENEDGDEAIIIIMSCARMHTLHIGRSLRRQQISRFARRRRAQRRKNGTISEEKSDVVVSTIPFVDVLAYTAYNNDKDDNVNDERRVYCEQNKIHGESEEIYNEYKNDNDVCASVSNNLCDKYEHEDVDKNVHCQDYIYTKVDAISRCILQNNQWISPSLSFDRRKLCHCCGYEHVDNYNCENSRHKKFIGQQRRKEAECKRRKCNDNTAWFQKPIIQKKRGDEKERGRSGESIVDKSRIRKSYYKLLLFMLYLLAWPLLCSTSPSGHLASTFAQKSTLAHAKNSAQQGNATLSDASLFLSSTIIMHQYQPQQYIQDNDHNTDNDKHHQHYHQQEQKQQQQWQEQKQSQQWQQQQQQQQQEKKEKREQQLEQEKRHPYNEYSWEINQMNPWLSACDLAGPAPADLQGSCGPPEVPKYCPMPCDNVMVTSRSQHNDIFREMIERIRIGAIKMTTTMTMTGTRMRTEIKDSYDRHRRTYRTKQNKEGKKIKEQEEKENIRTAPEQCLFYLEKSHKEDICRDNFGRASMRSFLTPRENRYWFMSGLRLRHCCEHTVVNALAPGKGGPLEDVLNGGRKCADALDKLLHVDALAARLHCEFEEVLARYDCAQPYSVIHNCTHCKVSNDYFFPYSIY